MKKMINILLVFVLMVTFFNGCGSKEEVLDTDFYIYYLDQLQTMLVKKSYTLKNKETKAEVEELLDIMSTRLEDSDRACPIPEDVKVEKFSIKNKKLKIIFNNEYTSLSPVREALMRAAVVKTLVQLDGVESISFMLEEEPLTDEDGNIVGEMTAESFVDDFGTEQGEVEEVELVLYYATEDSGALVKETREVHYNGNLSIEQVVLKYLSVEPETIGAIPTLSSDVKVLSVSTQDGVCYVDLDEKFLYDKTSLSQKIIIYSIVNSLCELDAISRVQIMVGSGENASVIGDADFYEADQRLVR